jgi:sulfoxide reductase heme-binding subunit YedZ
MPGGLRRVFKPAVFLAAALPGALLGLATYQGDLGVDPVTTLLHQSGRNTLLLLIITLGVTPARRLTGWNRLQSVRRMLGLWAFAYALAHVSMYLVFNQLCYSLATCDFGTIWDDVTTRSFIIAGMLSFTILVLLALTSTRGWIRRLGRNWQRLHWLIYLASGSALVHFAWKEKSDYTEAYQWGAVVAVLLAIRVYFAVRRRLVTARRARQV